jgi:hypothetical protein
MSWKNNRYDDAAALDRLIEGITVDAYGEGEQLWAFRQAFEDGVALPADAFVIGEPVFVLMGLCQSDMRCLDAHAHLGNFAGAWNEHQRES